MPIKKVKLITNTEQAGKRLDELLEDWLPGALGRPISKAKVRKLIMAGAVYSNKRLLRIASKTLVPGTTIEAHVDVTKLFHDFTVRDKKFELTAERILFEDEDLIVIDKPPGLPSQPTVDKARDSLLDAVRRFLSKRDGVESPYIGVHHRLDRDTSGVVLFTKSRRANAGIAESFSKHRVKKVYQALTVPRRESGAANKGATEWTIRNRIGRIPSKSKRRIYGAVPNDGDLAETFFRVVAEHPRGTWVEAVPRTGRTHQVRVHLAEYGLPILGDEQYGPAGDEPAPRLMLHASEMTFRHPITGAEMTIKSPLPADFTEVLHRIAKL